MSSAAISSKSWHGMIMRSGTRIDWWRWRNCIVFKVKKSIRSLKFVIMKVRSVKQLKNLSGKRVMARVDFNVPTDKGKVIDDSRILASIPTIAYLMKKGAKVILVSHLGRPEGYDKKLSLALVAGRLQEIFNFQFSIFKQFSISKFSNYFEKMREEIDKMKGGRVLMLENIRFFEGERENDKKFAKELAGLADYFVLDGFAVAHRDSPSVSGLAKYIPAYAGLLLEKEIIGLSKAIEKPKKPFVLVLGGAKMETKLPVLKNLLPKADYILIGGGIFNTYLKAKGYKVGKSLIDKEYKREALAYLKNKKVILPVDLVVGEADGRRAKVVKLREKGSLAPLGMTDAIYDIGPETIRMYAKYIKKAQTIVWNGAMGYFEQKPYDVGTLSVARLVASRSKGKAFGIIGGGETLQAMEKVKMMEFIDLVSTGGGAMLEFLAGKSLPGVKVLTR